MAPAASAEDEPTTVTCAVVEGAEAPGAQASDALVDALETGDVIRDGSASATVQPLGETVVANVLLVDGSETLTVGTEEDGEVFVEDCGSDEVDPSAPPPALNARKKGAFATISSPGECTDTAYNLTGFRWYWTYGWYFKQDTVPAGLSVANVTQALIDGTQSQTASRNTCGMVDTVFATQRYDGNTTTWANINTSGCLSTDWVSETDFAGGPAGVLAQTCTWLNEPGVAGQSDARFNSSLFSWMPTGEGTCGGRYVIRAVQAHERGHTFGVEHVAEGTHGNLTMSEQIGPCSDQEYWLGRGDVLGMRARYPFGWVVWLWGWWCRRLSSPPRLRPRWGHSPRIRLRQKACPRSSSTRSTRTR